MAQDGSKWRDRAVITDGEWFRQSANIAACRACTRVVMGGSGQLATMASKYRTIQTRKKLPAHMGARCCSVRDILRKYILRSVADTGVNGTPYTRHQYPRVFIDLLFLHLFTIIRAWFPGSGYLAVGPNPAWSLESGQQQHI